MVVNLVVITATKIIAVALVHKELVVAVIRVILLEAVVLNLVETTVVVLILAH